MRSSLRTGGQQSTRSHEREWQQSWTQAGKSRGFTLLEVLVALVVATLALGGVLAAVSQMADTGLTMRERTYASWIGQNKITELRLRNIIPEVEETRGEVEFAGQEWAWTANISETPVENLFRIDVDVSRPGSDDIIRSIVGFIGEPTPPGQSNQTWTANGQPGNSGGPRGQADGGSGDGDRN